MDLHQLIAFLTKIYVWTPQDSPMRQEIQNVLNHLKAQRQ